MPNPWVDFLNKHKGGGMTISELRDQYLSRDPNAPLVYMYDELADIKTDSLLDNLKADKRVFPKGIKNVTDKIENKDLDDITSKEEEAWRLAFEMALTNDYTLTKEQLFDDHDWWFRRLQNESGIEEGVLYNIMAKIQNTKHKDIYAFLDDLVPMFTLEELHSINFTDLSE